MNVPKQFRKLYTDKDFIEKFKNIKKDSIKRIPVQYKKCFVDESLIAKKQFHYMKEFMLDIILTNELLILILEYWKTAKRMNDFLSK